MAHPRRSPEEIERGLTALILAGSSTKASEACGISADTLRTWKRDHREQYDRLCESIEPQVVKKIAAEAENLAIRIADREAKIIASLDDTKIAELEAKDLAATLRNLSTAKALQIDKLSSPLRERPGYGGNAGLDVEGLMMRMLRAMGQQAPIPVLNEASVDSDVVDAVPLTPPSNNANAHDESPSSPASSST